MKLHIHCESGWWYCQLTSWGSVWLGQGNSPLNAFEDYLNIVLGADEPNKDHFDYDWCKSKGLIK